MSASDGRLAPVIDLAGARAARRRGQFLQACRDEIVWVCAEIDWSVEAAVARYLAADGRQSAPLDDLCPQDTVLLLAEMRGTFDRWVSATLMSTRTGTPRRGRCVCQPGQDGPTPEDRRLA